MEPNLSLVKTEPGSAPASGVCLVTYSRDGSDEKPTVLTHKEAMKQFKQGLSELILGDVYLDDLPTSITPEEVNSLVALEHGQAITVYLRRGDHSVLPVVVVHNGTVLDLKRAIRRHMTLKQERENGTTHISWKYVWKTNWLYFNGQKLTEDHKKLKDYGIGNRDEVSFMKRLRTNRRERHPQGD